MGCVTHTGRSIKKAFTTELFVIADSCGEAERKAIKTLERREKSTLSVVYSMERLNVLATFTRTEEEEEKVILDNWILYKVKRDDDSIESIFINEYDENRARKHVEAFLKDFCEDCTIVEAYGIDYVAR